MGDLKAGPFRGCCHLNNLFLSLDLWCKDLVLKKRIKLFWTLDCLYVPIRCLTLYKRWETKCWVLKGSVCLVLICDAKTWSYKKGKTVWDNELSLYAKRKFDFVLTLTLNCDAKTRSPKKKINWFGHWTVLIRLWGVKLCRDGRPKADSLVGRCHPNKILLSRDYLCKDLLPRKKSERKDSFGHWTVLIDWADVWPSKRDGRQKAYQGICFTQKLKTY